ncbi:ABC transporter ATP-binding protein [Sphingobium sp.]|uniref:ABC transporter ATP-binding protein n=1 Tax=Sphingobium sp. TaxID=1912891 RepID=UPI002635E496|nr:ABC transporter ATP-binding protein [Sphingobium sp.]
MVMLTLRGVGVTLGRRTVLRDIDASLTAGMLVGVVGPNGAGKSTLARAIMALVPSRGEIALDGRTVSTLRRPDLARQIAYLPQGQTLHWPLTVERLVGLGRLPHLGPMSRLGDADAAAIETAMLRADVADLRHRVATQLSGGERARVMLARALAVEAPALIADEPLASLDPGHQIDVMDLLRDQARQGALVIAVLHDLTMAARYCDRLILIDEGSLIADGSPQQVLTPDHLAMVYGIDARVDMEGAWPSIIPMGRRHL